MIYKHILNLVGNTPMVQIDLKDEFKNIRLYAKLEFYNPTGSVKDRAASYVLNKILDQGEIDRETTIIESSSGNFGIALSAFCRSMGLRFICVVDPCISPMNEMLMKSFGAEVVKVTTPDENGGYLLTRIRKVKQLCEDIKNSYWVNQYGNPYNAEAYYKSLGEEICNEVEQLDFIFLGISSGGTITGVSRKIKERFPEAKVIAVDIVGSVIFGHAPKKRYIPGIGSSMVPDILSQSKIDDVVMMDEITTIKSCHELLSKYNLFAGGSSGSVYAAIKNYFKINTVKEDRIVNVVTILPDRGERYCSTVYDEEWSSNFVHNQSELKDLH